MRAHRWGSLGIVAGAVVVAACSPDATDACRSVDDLLTQRSAIAIDEVPADSLVGPLLYWPDGGVPSGTLATLQSMDIEVVHVFHYQPAILVGATGTHLRAFVAQDSTVEVHFGATAVPLVGCQ